MPGSYQTRNPDSSFPAPKYFRVRDNPIRKNAILFFKYWHLLPEEKRDYVLVKVYRTWPRVNLGLTRPGLKSIAWEFVQGPIPFEPEDYRHWFMKNFGSGHWHCQMYEIHAESWAEIKVTECFFDAEDLENFCPLVDLRTVLWNEPANQRFAEYLRQRGIRIPGESNAARKAQEEAIEVRLVKALLAWNVRLDDRVNRLREQIRARKLRGHKLRRN